MTKGVLLEMKAFFNAQDCMQGSAKAHCAQGNTHHGTGKLQRHSASVTASKCSAKQCQHVAILVTCTVQGWSDSVLPHKDGRPT